MDIVAWMAEQDADLACHIEDEYRTRTGVFDMAEQYPYAETWNSLTAEQQMEVTRRANKAQVTIPDILGVERKSVQRAWKLLQDTPSYCERHATNAAAEKE